MSKTPREYLNRESNYVCGRAYLLRVVEDHAAPKVELRHRKRIVRLGPETNGEMKQAVVATRVVLLRPAPRI